MIEERFIEEIAKEIERVQAEMKFVEVEYNNYIEDLQYMYNTSKAFSGTEKPRRPYPYDMEELEKKHKDKIAKGIKPRF